MNNLENDPLYKLARTPEALETRRKRGGRPRAAVKNAEDGRTSDYTRATFVISIDLLKRLRSHVRAKNSTMKATIEEFITAGLDRAEGKE